MPRESAGYGVLRGIRNDIVTMRGFSGASPSRRRHMESWVRTPIAGRFLRFCIMN